MNRAHSSPLNLPGNAATPLSPALPPQASPRREKGALRTFLGVLFLGVIPSLALADVRIVDQRISTNSARDGETITLEYRLSSDSQRHGWLGATLVGPDGTTVDDPTNEHIVNDRITIREGSNWYEREFFINLPPSAPYNHYDVEWEIHWGGSGFDSSRQNNVLNIREPVRVDVPILMYHKVGDTAHSRFWVTAAQLESHIEALLDRGYTPVTLDDVVDYRAGIRTPPSKPVVISFDDGYEDLVTHVLPILESFDTDVTITAFVNPGLTGETNEWDPGIDFNEEPKVRHATWNQLQDLHNSGLVDIQSHGDTHENLLSVEGEERMRELVDARREIEQNLGTTVRHFAFPWGAGAQHDQVHRDVHRAGYFMSLGTNNVPDTQTRNKWALRRHEIHWNVTAEPDPDDPDNYLFGPALLNADGEGNHHPADTNQDWEIVTIELTSYAAAWLRGEHSETAALGRAAHIWLNGGTYIYNSNNSGANQWVPR